MPRKPHTSAQARTLFTFLLQQPRSWQYGYDLSRHTGLKSGTLYPLLIRLSEQGLLASQWQEPERPGKPPRHAYRLTAEGAAFARESVRQAAGQERKRVPGRRPIPASEGAAP